MIEPQLIWNIFSWLNFFDGKVQHNAVYSKEGEHWILFETERSSFSCNLSSNKDLLAANCVLTWWANMGIDHNENQNGENIFEFDLTKKVNRDKFVA